MTVNVRDSGTRYRRSVRQQETPFDTKRAQRHKARSDRQRNSGTASESEAHRHWTDAPDPLALHLGLRRKGALMCPRDLQMWLDALMHGESSIPLMRGAKNARPRDVRIVQSNRQDTIEAIRSALIYCQEHDFELITGSGKALKSAMNRLKALLRRAGMVGQASFHSLRYRYALTAASEMLDCGIAPYEVLVQLSESMGHGPTRAQMILEHYCQPIKIRIEGHISLP